jgi:RNA polymerase sigma-70 factor (ECF subfamily)
METSDEALMVAHCEGDPAAFGQLVGRYAGPLLGYLTRMVGDRHQAEDMFQETFMRVHTHAGSFRDGGRFKTWLFTIATRRSIDLLRKRGRRPASVSMDADELAPGLEAELADTGCDPGVATARAEVKEQVRHAVDSLPDRQRAVLLLAYFHGLTYAEVAEALTCSPGTVKTHMSRALQTLAKRLPELKGELA